MQRWVGIDEAGYGPNLGPMVMTAVIAESPNEHSSSHPHPDVWKDLSTKVSRAGGDAGLLWIDDSKRILRAGKGRDRLESACSLVIEQSGVSPPTSVRDLFHALKSGTLDDCELGRWLPHGSEDWAWPQPGSVEMIRQIRPLRPLVPSGSAWRIAQVRSVVVGPERFNTSLSRNRSKAGVHFEAFAELLRPLWAETCNGDRTTLSCDKHGGRHFYLEPLRGLFADESIECGPEGPAMSRYQVRQGDRSLDLSFAPRADAANGLVALASIVSKAVREIWMDAFNAFWKGRIPELKSTAGYPVDASRFRQQIEGLAIELGLEPRWWWREK